VSARDVALAEDYFRAASALDDGDESKREQAAAAYRKALEFDPYLVAALINLANIHYSRDELVEAQALYERAIGLESDFFEAHFNLGNIYHDLGRFTEAQACYTEALRLNPHYADAHFYLAVTLEKMGMSHEARPHWRAYRQLAPEGEWVELAKEFSE
jgi:tetratricopeptide (TPR) repeat protein